jgi:hypothetical protein
MPAEQSAAGGRTHECVATPTTRRVTEKAKAGDPMVRKILHIAYHFVTVADEIPRHIGHTN